MTHGDTRVNMGIVNVDAACHSTSLVRLVVSNTTISPHAHKSFHDGDVTGLCIVLSPSLHTRRLIFLGIR